MACMEVFQYIVTEGPGDHWPVMKHDNWSNIYKGLSVWEEINNILVPVLFLIRNSGLHGFVQ